MSEKWPTTLLPLLAARGKDLSSSSRLLPVVDLMFDACAFEQLAALGDLGKLHSPDLGRILAGPVRVIDPGSGLSLPTASVCELRSDNSRLSESSRL